MKTTDVLCVGNAIVDIIARCDDAFLTRNGIIKGAMNLIDAERAERLYERMGPAIETSGGSAGNTAAGIASFGGKAAFFGKVARDQLGDIYGHDIRAQGVAFATRAARRPSSDGALDDLRHAGRRALDEHLSRRVRRARPRRRRRGGGRIEQGSPISKAIYGIRRGPRRRSGNARGSPTRTAARWR